MPSSQNFPRPLLLLLLRVSTTALRQTLCSQPAHSPLPSPPPQAAAVLRAACISSISRARLWPRSWLPRARAPLGRPAEAEAVGPAICTLPWSPREFAGASETSSIARLTIACRLPPPIRSAAHAVSRAPVSISPLHRWSIQQALQRGSPNTRIPAPIPRQTHPAPQAPSRPVVPQRQTTP